MRAWLAQRPPGISRLRAALAEAAVEDSTCAAGAGLRPITVMAARHAERRRLASGRRAKARAAGISLALTALLSVALAFASLPGAEEPGVTFTPAVAVSALDGPPATAPEAAGPPPEAAPPGAGIAGPSSASLTSDGAATASGVVALRIVEPQPIPVTLGELYQALARSPWPRELWSEVARIAQCESRWGSGVDAAAEGDSGRALGALQIRVDAHRELARSYDLLTLDGALAAAWEVYQQAGYSFAPWSCS